MTPAMPSDAKQQLAPKLRFPKFRGPWEAMTLGDITFKTDKKNKAGKKYPIYSINNTAGFVPQAEQFDGVDSNKRGYDTTLYKVIEKNTFAYNPARINVGSIGYSEGLNNILISSLYVCFKTQKNVDDKFLSHFFTSSIFDKSVNSKAEGGIRSYLFYENFSRIKILLPDIEEQQKIAECLSTLDELMGAESQKLDALKAHKKGLMQQLFPRAGETRPRLRFPEFQNAPEWDVKPLEQVVTYENGKAHENDISDDGKYVVVNSKFISTEGKVRKFSNEAFCMTDFGDVLMVLSDVPNGKAIAKCYYVESDKLYTVNQRICKIKPTGIDGKLLFNILDRNPFFLAFDDGVKQTNLRKEDVLNCPICFPSLPEEQKRIGDSISSITDLIAAQSAKLAALQTHKQGLMQQLFPTLQDIES